MLGPNLLVAPVFDDDGRRRVLRPAWPLGGAARRPGRRGPRVGPSAARRPLPAAARASRCGDRGGQPLGPARLRRRRRAELRGLRPRRRHVVDHAPVRRPGARAGVGSGVAQREPGRGGGRGRARAPVRRLEPHLGDRALRQPHRTHGPSGIRSGDPASGPRPGPDRRPRRIARRRGSQSCLPQHTLGSQSAESPNRHGGETT